MRERLKALNDELLLMTGQLLLKAIEVLIFLLGQIASQQSVTSVLYQLARQDEYTQMGNVHQDMLGFRPLTVRQLRLLSLHRLYTQLRSAADGIADGG